MYHTYGTPASVPLPCAAMFLSTVWRRPVSNRSVRVLRALTLATMLLAASCAPPAPSRSTPSPPPAASGYPVAMTVDERNESDSYAKILLDIEGRIAPEDAAQLGVAGLDERVTDWSAASFAAEIAAFEAAEKQIETLEHRRLAPAV